jgi:16S rRNA (cytosine967-C5)-methyltransferase
LSVETGAAIRALAAKINAGVVGGGLSLEQSLARSPQPDTRDIGLLRSLSSGVLRWHHRLQWQISELLDRPLKTRDAELAALLRLGLFQLQWLRVPDHAAVSATVGATQQLGAVRAKGLVNAVLRRFLRERDAMERRMAAIPEALESHPGWLLNMLQSDWPEQWRGIVAASNEMPPMWLRVNDCRLPRADYLGMLSAADIGVEESRQGDSAILLLEPQPMNTLPGYTEGLVAVQDAAAQLAAGYLQLAPGQRVLDACAAPGGKSAHILETCRDLAELVILDHDTARLADLRESLRRLGHVGTIVEGDALRPSSWWDGRPFDRILLDAPCSALGVIRRHPDIKLRRRETDVEQVCATQKHLLRSLWPLLAPGGMMLYAVCTTTHSETVKQVAKFLEYSPDARFAGPGVERGRQILPGEANMDGFYYACLYKKE